MQEQLIQQISNDLKITSYTNETKKEFYSRLLYTSVSCWLRYSIMDKSNNDADMEKKSKKYVLARGKDILDSYVEMFPECFDYFCIKDNHVIHIEESIKCIRERMLNSGELLEIEENRYITLPNHYIKNISCSISREFGLSNIDFINKYVGIARILKSEEVSFSDNSLNIVNPLDFFEWLIKNAKWEKINNPENFKIFDAYSKRIPTFSWVSCQINLLKDSYYLAKNDDLLQFGKTQYFLLKNDNDKYYISKIESILVDWNEYRRVIFALRKRVDNKMIAQATNRGNCVILKLFCGLPLREQIILETYCWPKKNIFDTTEYVISIDIWGYIKDVLKTLCIDVEEVL